MVQAHVFREAEEGVHVHVWDSIRESCEKMYIIIIITHVLYMYMYM